LTHAAITTLACRRAFQHYILQDAFFLSHFARAYAAALDKATASSRQPGGDDSAASDVLQTLLLGVHTELQLHGGYAAQWGVDASAAGVSPSPATAAYCAFLLEVADDPQVCWDAAGRAVVAVGERLLAPTAGRNSITADPCAPVTPPHHHLLPLSLHRTTQTRVAEVLAAMIPCARLYGFLGCRLASATAHLAPHAYSDWVATYSSAEYLVSEAAAVAAVCLVCGWGSADASSAGVSASADDSCVARRPTLCRRAQ
jgi:thiaminase